MLWLGYRYHHATAVNGVITYAGIDSMGEAFPENQAALSLKAGALQPDPGAMVTVNRLGGDPRQLAVVGLAATPTYGRFIEMIRQLRARRLCNLAIRRERAQGLTPFISDRFKAGTEGFEYTPWLVLCGGSIGDTGFQGTLPPDSKIHI